MKNKSLFLIAVAALCAGKVSAQCISGNCEDGYGVYIDDNGNRYSGFFKDGNYNGQGTLIFNGGDVYKGNFKDDEFSGKGTYIWGDSGEKYFGHWENGKRQGIGTVSSDDGTTSTDIWIDDDISENEISSGCVNGDCQTGYGVYVYKDGATYEGYWKKGWFWGEGVYRGADGSVYSGCYEKGWRTGFGTVTNPDGTQKTGLWEKGRFIGELNPSNTEGCVSGDCYNGYGVMVYQDKGVYLGDFKNGKSHGDGVYYAPDGTRYEGSFENDKVSGFVRIYKEEDGSTYIGNFLNGSANGFGTYIVPNENMLYYGEYQNNNFTGEGVQYNLETRKKVSGVFINGELVKEKPESDLKLIYGDKNGFGIRLTETGMYSGALKNGVPEGNGFLACYSGWTITGEFRNGISYGKGTLENVSEGKRYIGDIKNNAANGQGTLYYADGTSTTGYFKDGELVTEKPQDTNVAKPEVSWTTPQMINTETEETKTTVKLCVSSKTPVSEVIVTVNGTPQVKKALSRGFTVVTSDCDYSFEYELTLSPGQNKIEATVKNDGGTASAGVRYVTLKKSDAVSAQKRVALVIGNADYQNISRLANSANDAVLMSETLKKLGFEVLSFTNLDRRTMTDKIYDFGDKLKEENAVGLFYYAGHGLQVNGTNYLVPVSAKVQREQEVDDECVSIDKVLGQMEYAGNDLNIIILDACRNNPFAAVSRSATGDGGLAQMNAPKGTFVAYATAPGKTASDGTGQNGLYTEQLAKTLSIPGLKIEDVFKNVRNEVYKISKEMGTEQIPWENSSIFGDFYFKK